MECTTKLAGTWVVEREKDKRRIEVPDGQPTTGEKLGDAVAELLRERPNSSLSFYHVPHPDAPPDA